MIYFHLNLTAVLIGGHQKGTIVTVNLIGRLRIFTTRTYSMARKAREIGSTNIYHVILRSVNQQQIFEEEQDYRKFLYAISDCKKKYDFSLFGYCLMGNHIHMLMQSDIPIGQIIKSISERFVYWYNRKYQRFGHLFQGRFISKPVDTEEYFVTTLNYIHQNPVNAAMITSAAQYRWSSCSAYFGQKNDLVNCDFAFALVGGKDNLHNIWSKQSLDDFYEQGENPPKIGLNLSEENAIIKFREITDCLSPFDFLNLNRTSRNNFIYELFKSGLSKLQISRLTGVSRTTIWRVLDRKEAEKKET